jgi:drug/metabolite transporter (DMT)-like permease
MAGVKQNVRLAILFMSAVSLIFSVQDGISRHLSETYNVFVVNMLRYWFFGLLVLAMAQVSQGGIRKVARTSQPLLQLARGALLITETLMVIWAFTRIGLAESHAIFAAYPLIAAALSMPLLGERVGWRRWLAIGFGFCGVLVILQPGVQVVSGVSLVALAAAGMFALYTVLTRLAARKDSPQTNFFYTGVTGAIFTSIVGLPNWQVMSPPDYAWMLALCITGTTGHFLLIRAVAMADAATVQPFAYLQMIFASAIGIMVFGETIDIYVVIGAAMIVAAGLFTIWRERRAQSRSSPSALPSVSGPV